MKKTKQEYNKTYYDKHYKDKIFVLLSAKICCPICEKEMTYSNLSKHKKTKKHLEKEEIQQNSQKIDSN